MKSLVITVALAIFGTQAAHALTYKCHVTGMDGSRTEISIDDKTFDGISNTIYGPGTDGDTFELPGKAFMSLGGMGKDLALIVSWSHPFGTYTSAMAVNLDNDQKVYEGKAYALTEFDANGPITKAEFGPIKCETTEGILRTLGAAKSMKQMLRK